MQIKSFIFLRGRMTPKGELTHFVSVQETLRRRTKLRLVTMSQHEIFNVGSEKAECKKLKTAFDVATQIGGVATYP